jgi:hypothetical protein
MTDAVPRVSFAATTPAPAREALTAATPTVWAKPRTLRGLRGWMGLEQGKWNGDLGGCKRLLCHAVQ